MAELIKSFEGVRGSAAILVALFHLYSANLLPVACQSISLIVNGYIFVDLFFVLSGYVIVSAYHNRLNSTNEIVSFIIRRFGRLFPLLVFATLSFVAAQNFVVFIENVFVSLGFVVHHSIAVSYSVPSISEILSTLTFTHGLGIFDRLILNYASWSISTEFYAYMVFLILWAGIHQKWRTIALAVVGLGCLVIADWASIHYHDCIVKAGCGGVTYDFGFLRCVGSFMLGIFVWKLPKPAERFVFLLQGLALAFVCTLFYLAPAFPPIMFLAPAVFSMAIYSISTDSGPVAKFFTLGFFQMLGQRSYSIYLLHPILLTLMSSGMHQLHGTLANGFVLLAYLPMLTVIAGWTYRYVEDPMRKYFNGLASQIMIAPTRPALRATKK